jgi:hypothetical protein
MMEPKADATEFASLQAVSQLRLEALITELTRRAMVVNDDALTHLLQRGVLAPVAAAGCCKPDGGTCCPNKRLNLEPGIGRAADQSA